MIEATKSGGERRDGVGRRLGAAVTVIGGVLVVGGEPVSGAPMTFTVDSLQDDGTGGLTLREAIQDASLNSGADVIVFDPSIVPGTITLDGSALEVESDLEIRGAGMIIDGGTSPNDAIYVHNDTTVTISGFTIRNADRHGVRTADTNDVTLDDVTIAGSAGHGIEFFSTDALLTITDSVIEDNTGDGVHIGRAADRPSGLVIRDSNISGNRDALYAKYITGDLTVSGTTLATNNRAAYFYAIDGTVTLDETTVRNNANGMEGTAIGALTVTDSTFSENLESGLDLSDIGDVVITRSTFDGHDGDGVDLEVLGTIEIVDSSADGNGSSGFRVEAATVSVSGGGAEDNGAFGMNVDGNGADSAGLSVEVSDVVVNRSGADGIEIDADGDAIVERVAIDSSGGEGLDVSVRMGGATLLADVLISNSERAGVQAALTAPATMRMDRVTIDGAEREGVRISFFDPAASPATEFDYGNQDSGYQNDGDPNGEGDHPGGNDGSSNLAADDADVVIVNSTITGAASAADSSVLVLSRADVVVQNSTITGNGVGSTTKATVSASSGTADPVFVNTILTDNSGRPVFASFDGRSLDITSSITPLGSGLGLTNIETDDPLLEPIVDTGGFAETMRPALGSPAIDAGSESAGSIPTTDQRGLPRVSNLIDIGAVEVNAGTVSVSDATVNESSGTAQVVVTRSGALEAAASIDASTVPQTALAGIDFTSIEDTRVWIEGENGTRNVTIPITDDDAHEGTDETFAVIVSASPGVSVGDGSATVTIVDDDPDDDPPVATGAAINPLSPERFVDTRSGGVTADGLFAAGGRRDADSEYRVEIAGRRNVPADARAVVMNVTAIRPDGTGFVTIHPCVSPRPVASSLNVTDGVSLGNEVTVPLADDGTICVYTSANMDLTVDVVGFVARQSPLEPLTPARILDTRSAGSTVDGLRQADGRTDAAGTVRLQVGGRADVPTGAAAAIMNVTAIGADQVGFVTAHPCSATVPIAASLNYVPSVNRGNELIAPLSADGEVCFFTSSSIELVVDVTGYVPAGTTLNPLLPARLLDTRSTGSTVDGEQIGAGKQEAESERTLGIVGRGGVPSSATAVIVNVTAIATEEIGFVTVHPCVTPRPTTAALNYVPGVNGGNEIIASLNADGELCLYSSATTHLAVDVVGYLV